MPNWATTEYVFVGKDDEQNKDLYEKMVSLDKMDNPLVKNAFGNLWLGCLVELLGGKCEEVYCRGCITWYELFDNHVTIECQNAWGEMPEFREFVEQHYPGSKIYYRVEEFGGCVYATNDKEGKYFPERYVFDSSDGQEFFNTLEEAAHYISYVIDDEDIKLEPDYDKICEAVGKHYKRLNARNKWGNFHEYEIIEK